MNDRNRRGWAAANLCIGSQTYSTQAIEEMLGVPDASGRGQYFVHYATRVHSDPLQSQLAAVKAFLSEKATPLRAVAPNNEIFLHIGWRLDGPKEPLYFDSELIGLLGSINAYILFDTYIDGEWETSRGSVNVTVRSDVHAISEIARRFDLATPDPGSVTLTWPLGPKAADEPVHDELELAEPHILERLQTLGQLHADVNLRLEWVPRAPQDGIGIIETLIKQLADHNANLVIDITLDTQLLETPPN